VLPTHNHHRKLYSEAGVGRAERKFQLTVKSKEIKIPDEIKSLLKTQVNPRDKPQNYVNQTAERW